MQNSTVFYISIYAAVTGVGETFIITHSLHTIIPMSSMLRSCLLDLQVVCSL